ncbi:hypothetical protein ACDX78_15120 [Virgibacillus oceani]
MFRFITFASMCLLYITQELISNEVLNTIYILLCILAFLLAFQMLSKKNRLFTGFLFVTGIIINVIYGSQWLGLFDGITQNIALLAIILLAPLISLPLEGEGVINSVISKLNEFKNDERKTFYGVSSFMVIVAPILNMGGIRIVHGFVSRLKIESKLLSRAYFGGFTQAIVWSPFFASVGIVISIAEMPYITYMPIGVFFSVLMFMTAIFLLRPAKSETAAALEALQAETEASKRDFALLISLVLFLVGLLIALELITKLPMLLLVSINCLLIPLLWTLIRNKWGWMKEQIKIYKVQMNTNSNMEIALFLSAGLFGNALLHTPITSGLGNALFWASQWSVLLVFLFVVTFVTMMAFLGIHQIIAVPIIFPLLLVPEVDVNLFAAAFMCIFSWMFSSSLSPLNALNIIISSCVHANGIRVGFFWNGKYFLTIFILGFAYVFFLNLL